MRVVLLLVAAAFLIPRSGLSTPRGVTEAAAGPQGFSLVVTLPDGPMDVVLRDGEPPAIVCPGLPSTPAPSGWQLPERVYWIGIPSQGAVEVTHEVLDREPLELRVDLPAGFPGDRLPEQSITVSPPSWMRNQRVVAVTWRPVVASGSAGAIELRIRIAARFSDPRPSGGRGDDRFEDVYRSLLVNYDQAREWRRGPSMLPRRSLAREGDSFSSTPNPWFRMEAPSTGIYAVTGADLQAAGWSDLGSIDPSTLRLFTGSGAPLSERTTYAEQPSWMNEVAISVEAPGSTFDAQSKILFRGLGPDGWYSDYGLPDARHERYRSDPYTNVNVYWLTWGGTFTGEPRRWPTIDGTGLPAEVDESAPVRLHFEEDNFWDPRPWDVRSGSPPYPDSLPKWERWHWQQLAATPGGQGFRIPFVLPDPDPSHGAELVARFWGTTWQTGGTLKDHYVGVWWGADSAGAAWDEITRADVRLSVAGPSTSEQSLLVREIYQAEGGVGRVDRSNLAWFEVDYHRRLRAAGDSIQFLVEAGIGPRGYRVTGLSTSASIAVLDVTHPTTPVRVTGTFTPDGATRSVAFAVNPDSDRLRTIMLTDLATARTPGITIDTPPEGGYLRERSDAIDYILLTHSSFMDAAERLAAWRREHGPEGEGFRVAVIDVQDVYDEFAAGRLDPTSIRSFLQFAFDTWNGGDPSAAPSYVLFFGDATYDFRDHAREGNVAYVPTYEGYYDGGLRRTPYSTQFGSDDWFLLFDGGLDPAMDMAAGRLPADSPQSAQVLADKVIAYDSGQDVGPWRQRFTLVADDICQGLEYDNPLYFTHMRQTEDLADDILPGELQRDRIYLYEYGTECVYDRKPAAAAALRSSIDEGTLVVNYTGHGSEGQLADERVLETPGVASMTNGDRLFFFLTASCSVGKFDAAGEGLGEALVRQPSGGAIGVFSSTAVAFSGANAELNQEVFAAMFPQRDTRRARSLGNGAVIAKASVGSPMSLNNRRYPLLGEPGVRLDTPRNGIRMEIESLRPEAPAAADTMLRGAEIVVRGSVVDTLGAVLDDFQGTASVRIYDSELVRADSISFSNVEYNLTGAPIFRGEVPVQNGAFSLSFISPSALRSGQRGLAQVYAYARGTSGVSAMGSRIDIFVPENESVLSPDEAGPVITIQTEHDTDRMPPQGTWSITLEDESGINITQLVPNRSVLVRIESGTELVHLEDVAARVTFPEGYRKGILEYRLPAGLDDGVEYTLTVSATDNLNTGTERSAAFRVLGEDSSGMVLGRVYNVPNPMEDGGTVFFVEISEPASVEIRIHTVTGRVLRTLRTGLLTPEAAGQGGIVWDGRDEDGDGLSNGVYFYKVKVRGASGEQRERIERLAVLR